MVQRGVYGLHFFPFWGWHHSIEFVKSRVPCSSVHSPLIDKGARCRRASVTPIDRLYFVIG